MENRCDCGKKLYAGYCLYCNERLIKAKLMRYVKDIWNGEELDWKAFDFLRIIKENCPILTEQFPILFKRLR